MDLLQLIRQPEILDAICINLSSTEIIELYKSLKIRKLNCTLLVSDKDQKITQLYPVNNRIIQLYQLISDIGSSQSLMFLANTGNLELIKELLDRGISANTVNRYNNPVLIEAAAMDHLNVVRELLNRGANIDAQNPSGQTALLMAIAMDRPQVIQELLKRGANIETANSDGMTPLIYAAYINKPKIVQELINRRANILATDKYGRNYKNVRTFSRMIPILPQIPR